MTLIREIVAPSPTMRIGTLATCSIRGCQFVPIAFFVSRDSMPGRKWDRAYTTRRYCVLHLRAAAKRYRLAVPDGVDLKARAQRIPPDHPRSHGPGQRPSLAGSGAEPQLNGGTR